MPKSVHSAEAAQVSSAETAAILQFASRHLGDDGDFVEFGCYRGDTSVLLARQLYSAKSAQQLWLYDSFSGLPAKTTFDLSPAGEQFQAGELLTSKSALILRFKKLGLPLPIIKKAFFSELNPVSDLPERISFGFLDGDLYDSILTSLNLVYSRLSKGATLIVHDYNNPALPGVARAVDQWLGKISLKPRLTVTETLAILEFPR